MRKTDEAFIILVHERDELKERLDKLSPFIQDARAGKVRDIQLDDIKLLEEQELYMIKYLRILNTRIFRVTGE